MLKSGSRKLLDDILKSNLDQETIVEELKRLCHTADIIESQDDEEEEEEEEEGLPDAILDEENDVLICSECAWEIEDGECFKCGTLHAEYQDVSWYFVSTLVWREV